MEIKLRKWGNSIGLRIPHNLAQSFGIDENSTVEISELEDTLILRKKPNIDLNELIDSIPDNFVYPDDLADFINSEPVGEELI